MARIFSSLPRPAAHWLLPLAVCALCALLPWLSAWQTLEKRGFDLLTVASAPGTTPQEDAALAIAIASAGNVILATGLVREETPVGTLWTRQEPLPQFLAAGAQTGVVNLNFDADLVMRQLPLEADAFWRRILFRLRQALPEQELPGNVPPQADRPAALAAWQRVQQLAPDDPLAQHALATLAEGDWDGVLAVHK